VRRWATGSREGRTTTVYQIGREPVRDRLLLRFPTQTNLWTELNVPGAMLRFTELAGEVILETIK
jgi:hypothetical protein